MIWRQSHRTWGERSTLNDMGKGKLKEDLMCTFENRCGWAEHSDSRVAKAFR